MSPAASVFLPSFNKPRYVTEAIASVLAQDYPDFELWILENSTDPATREAIAPLLGDPRIIYEEITLTEQERHGTYPTALLLNRYYPKANGRYIFYLSDDDLLEPSCVGRCVRLFDQDPAKSVCWFSLQHCSLIGGEFRVTSGIVAGWQAGAGTDMPVVDCRIDGGQIAHRKDCLDVIGHPYFPESPDPGIACHVDGLFMAKLAEHYTFHPIREILVTHRRTPLSTWDKG